ncbi:MAG TPA: F0F1 ATP synthase subunit gamma [Herpetosiphonaceae bacterium]|nr:F0F1 ATP synthase subunit gamma [Herpetosiphonaceae bacterium]
MATAREIRRRIRSVKNTGKITKAMEMVSAAKMRRAQRNTLATRPYAERMRDVMADLSVRAGRTLAHPLLTQRENVRTIGLVLITPDRGLCGGLVSNINRMASRFIVERRDRGQEIQLVTVGRKGRDFALRTRMPLVAEVTGIGDAPALIDILPVATNVITGFVEGRFDEVQVIFTAFENTLVQRATMRRLLPMEAIEDTGGSKVDYTYEPDQQTVLNALLPRFVEVQLYAMILESIASEHSARMMAMRNATDNAKELVRDLTLSMNKARQAAITKELAEIAAGSLR